MDRMNDQVTFHIIFQGQYLPPNFSWKTLSLYYDKSEKREREQETEQKKCLLYISLLVEVDEESNSVYLDYTMLKEVCSF